MSIRLGVRELVVRWGDGRPKRVPKGCSEVVFFIGGSGQCWLVCLLFATPYEKSCRGPQLFVVCVRSVGGWPRGGSYAREIVQSG